MQVRIAGNIPVALCLKEVGFLPDIVKIKQIHNGAPSVKVKYCLYIIPQLACDVYIRVLRFRKNDWRNGMIIPLYLGQFLCGALGTYSRQKYGRTARNRGDYFVYVIITGVIAMGTFCFMSGFSFSFNARTVIYSVIFAAAIILGHVLTLLRLRLMEIMQITLISGPLSLIMTMIVGRWLFSENITWISMLRVLLSAVAALLAVRGMKKTDTRDKHRFLLGLCLCVILVVQGVFATVLQKAFAMDPGVTDANSMFFLTNAWMVAISVLILLALDKGHISHVLLDFKGLGLWQYGVTVLGTVSDNISTVLNVQLLAIVPMSIHTPVSGAVGKLSAAAVAGLIVKEKVPPVPVVLAIVSTLLTFFEL